jgi:hypothetical protein
VKTYGDVLVEYEWHPEAKCAGGDGLPSVKRTIGLLQRRHVRIERVKYIGKESNHLEEVESGLVHAAESVYTEYPDPRHDEWRAITDALWKVSLDEFEKLTGKSRRMLIDARARRRQPQLRNRLLLVAVARRVGALKYKRARAGAARRERHQSTNALRGTTLPQPVRDRAHSPRHLRDLNIADPMFCGGRANASRFGLDDDITDFDRVSLLVVLDPLPRRPAKVS